MSKLLEWVKTGEKLEIEKWKTYQAVVNVMRVHCRDGVLLAYCALFLRKGVGRLPSIGQKLMKLGIIQLWMGCMKSMPQDDILQVFCGSM